MDLEKFFLSTQKGGPTDKEVQEYMKEKNISTLSELVRYVREKQKQNKQKASWSDRVSRGQVPSKRKQAEEAQLKAYGQPRRKAHGGYVKKYAKGGGVRKVRT
jgi:hypothetical protein